MNKLPLIDKIIVALDRNLYIDQYIKEEKKEEEKKAPHRVMQLAGGHNIARFQFGQAPIAPPIAGKYDDDESDISDDDQKIIDPIDPIDPKQFWPIITKLNWVDVGEGFNKKTPTIVWSYTEYKCIKDNINIYIAPLEKILEDKFWGLHPDYQANEQKKIKFIYHIIAKGKNLYDGIMNDVFFAAAFTGVEDDFIKFLEKY